MLRKSIAGLVLITAVYTAPATAQAQFGIMAGATSTSLSVTPDEGATFSSRIGFVGGISADIGMGKSLTFSPEVLYAMKGADASQTIDGQSLSEKTKINYLDIPILFRLKLSNNASHYAFITAGPSIEFQLSCSIEESSGDDSGPCSEKGDPTSGFKSTDFSGVVGVGLVSNRLSLNVRYGFGLTNISNDPGETVKGHAITALIGIALGK